MEPPSTPPPQPGPFEPRPVEPAFPLTRTDYSLSDLLSRASEAWSRDLGAWVLAVVLYVLIGIGIPMMLGFFTGFFGGFQGSAWSGLRITIEAATQIIQLVLSAIFTLGFWAMALRGLHGEPARVGALFSQLSKIWKYILQSLALGLGLLLIIAPIIVIIFLAFVGPVDRSTPMSEIIESAGMPLAITVVVAAPLYIYAILGLVFAQVELAFNDDAGPIDAIIYSWRIARGKRWSILGVLLISTLIFMGSLMLCGIGVLFGAPLATLLTGALYLALRQGADLPPANSATTLGRRY
ncbi:MAG: hypothetical protein AMJ63_14095 [Myxococcales bacterium SG8_38_1]|jgi:hypothetical protein|nr:MAG: hypothetical protein AMJ63_14095 [Myxococcales bacterium SG8_38_1]